jgi:hypothetical protein
VRPSAIAVSVLRARCRRVLRTLATANDALVPLVDSATGPTLELEPGVEPAGRSAGARRPPAAGGLGTPGLPSQRADSARRVSREVFERVADPADVVPRGAAEAPTIPDRIAPPSASAERSTAHERYRADPKGPRDESAAVHAARAANLTGGVFRRGVAHRAGGDAAHRARKAERRTCCGRSMRRRAKRFGCVATCNSSQDSVCSPQN